MSVLCANNDGRNVNRWQCWCLAVVQMTGLYLQACGQICCVECVDEKRNALRVLVGKPEGKRPLGRPRRRWADKVKISLKE